MAEVISHHHHHTMIAGTGSQRSPAESYRQRSKSRTEVPPSPRPQPQPQTVPSVAITTTPPTSTDTRAIEEQEDVAGSSYVKTEPPSPPSSSGPNPASYTRQPFASQQQAPPADAPYKEEPEDAEIDSKVKVEGSMAAPPPIPRSARSLDNVQIHGRHTIKVRDLAHIQSFASEEYSPLRGQSGRRRTADDPALKYEISGMPIGDIIEMVAGLLTKITTTNDRQHENLHCPIPTEHTVNIGGLSSSVLAFHGKNVPSITILSYLSRIHKYCPTTYEVFLSLLVYFDRMTERVNAAPMQALRQPSLDDENSRPSTSYSADGSDLADSPLIPASSRSVPEIKDDLEKAQYSHAPAQIPSPESDPTQFPPSHFFVVDSFNIHRLVIAGVTCASKFFSDVFYTNSRYAKVCFS